MEKDKSNAREIKCITVYICENCSSHQWCTRHNEVKY